MGWKYPESLKPVPAGILIVLFGTWIALGNYMQAREAGALLLGLPVWLHQSLAVVVILAMIGVILDRGHRRLHASEGVAIVPPAPAPAKKLPWWKGLARPSKDALRANELSGRLMLAQTGLNVQKAEIAALRGELDNAKADRDDWKRSNRLRFEELKYGAELPEMTALTEAETVAVRPALEELQVNLGAALDTADKVWAALVFECKNKGEQSGLWWLEVFLREGFYGELARTNALLREKFERGDDVRPALVRLYKLYRTWREWIVRLGVLVEKHATTLPGYAEWFRADAEFLKELRRKLKISQLAEVREAVEAFDQQRGATDRDMPGPASGAGGIW